jgi:hypothetical protein
MMATPSNEVRSATGGKLITPGTPFNVCRAVNCAAEGAGTVTWADGSSTTYFFTAGTTNPIQITNVAGGGAHGTLVALY